MRTLAVNALRLVGNRTAMGHYIEYMANYWSQMPIPFDRIELISPVAVSLVVQETRGPTKVNVRHVGEGWPLSLWEQVLLPRVAKDASLLFCPAYTGPLVYGGRLVVANHGIYEALPREFGWLRRLRATPLNRLSALRATRVIANSQTTRGDLVKYFGIASENVEVVYPAAHPVFFERQDPALVEQEVVDALGKVVPYLIFVGKLSKRRNVPNLIEAFARAREGSSLPHHLLIVGPNVNQLPLEEIAGHFGVAAFVKHLPYRGQDQLARLYAGADLYVLPTTYEGISWTMFEAMASGTPVLTVDHPTLWEGAADAAYSVPSPAADELAQGLTTLLTNPGLRDEYARRGRERVGRFTWQEAARATMEVLDRIALPLDRVGMRQPLSVR